MCRSMSGISRNVVYCRVDLDYVRAFGISVFSLELIVLQLLPLVIMVVDYDGDVLGI